MTTHHVDGPHDPLERVRHALTRAPQLRAALLDVRFEGETVVLDGSVRTWYQKQIAQEWVRRVEGVTEIRNRIAVVRA